MNDKKRATIKPLTIIFTFVVILITIPLVMIGFNKLISWHLNSSYPSIDAQPSNAHYIIKKIATGNFNNPYYPPHGLVDTGDALIKRLGVDYRQGFNSDDTTRNGSVYFDTLKYEFKINYSRSVLSKKDTGTYEDIAHYSTFNQKGIVLNNVTDTNLTNIINLKNCVILKDVLQPWQKWSDKSKLIYMTHFAEDDFRWPTLNLYAGNSTGPHNYWDGYGYYCINRNHEELKFKIPCQSSAVWWPHDDDMNTSLDLYMLPYSFRNKLDVRFLLHRENSENQSLYMVLRK